MFLAICGCKMYLLHYMQLQHNNCEYFSKVALLLELLIQKVIPYIGRGVLPQHYRPMLQEILPLLSITVVENRLWQREVILTNRCPVRWQKFQILPNVDKFVGPFSRSKTTCRANLHNSGENHNIFVEKNVMYVCK